MNPLKKIFGIALLGVFLSLAAPQKSMAQDGGYVSDQEFYDNLQQYGTWVYDSNYGNVWVPDVDGDFRPYATRGHWVQTDYGSTWVSDYPWGWATFHYGRWRYDDYYGWEWIPGHEWAPAWVSWRHGGGYYGWAPLMPGISITVSFGGGYNVPDNYWVCAPDRYITSPNIYNYYVPHTRAVTIIRNTTIIHNTYVYNNQTYITGPRPRDIQNITHQHVQVYKINNASRPGANEVRNNAVNIYRPAIKASPNARPERVVNATAYKQANPKQRIGTSGAAGYNRANASRLATTARSTAPNQKVVQVNKRPEQPAANRPAPNTNQPAKPNTPGANNRASGQPSEKQVNGHEHSPGMVRPTEPNAAKQPATNTQEQQRQQQAQHQQQGQQEQKQQAQKQEQQHQQQAQQTQKQEQQRAQQTQQQQQAQQRQQQQVQQQKQQQAQQQQAQQRQQQQKQQQAQQQQAQQHQQQQAQQQQAQQRQQQQVQQQKQQQAQQQQAQQRQQQQAQHQQQQAQRQQQQAQQHHQQQPPPKEEPKKDDGH